jgi:hypothetical protein
MPLFRASVSEGVEYLILGLYLVREQNTACFRVSVSKEAECGLF